MVRDHRSASTIRNHRREPQEAVWGGLLCVPDVLIPISSSGNGGIGQHAAGQGAPQHRERRRSACMIVSADRLTDCLSHSALLSTYCKSRPGWTPWL